MSIKKRKFILSLLIAIPVGLLLLLSYGLFIEPYWLEYKTVELTDTDIPSPFDDFRIVFVTDIHNSKVFPIERIETLVAKINTMEPDLVILGGDYTFDGEKYIEPCFEALSSLHATYGVYGVFGNHDHWDGIDTARQAMQNAGIVSLENKSYWIELQGQESSSQIKLGGVGDSWEGNQDIRTTTNDVIEDDFVILVSHNPDIAERINDDKIDLVLSGHNHGGHISFFGLWAPVVPSGYGSKYLTGVKKFEHTTVVISNGIGVSTYPPIRLFARPQVYTIVLNTD